MRGVQDEAVIKGALLPLGTDETLPILDVGRGPSGKPLRQARAMEGGRDGASGSVAGRNDKAAVAQPDVDLLDIYAGTCLRKSPIPGLYAPWRRKSLSCRSFGITGSKLAPLFEFGKLGSSRILEIDTEFNLHRCR